MMFNSFDSCASLLDDMLAISQSAVLHAVGLGSLFLLTVFHLHSVPLIQSGPRGCTWTGHTKDRLLGGYTRSRRGRLKSISGWSGDMVGKGSPGFTQAYEEKIFNNASS